MEIWSKLNWFIPFANRDPLKTVFQYFEAEWFVISNLLGKKRFINLDVLTTCLD
jgi:hypothetical protein